MGMGWGIFLWGWGGDGENFMGMGTILFTVSLSNSKGLWQVAVTTVHNQRVTRKEVFRSTLHATSCITARNADKT